MSVEIHQVIVDYRPPTEGGSFGGTSPIPLIMPGLLGGKSLGGKLFTGVGKVSGERIGYNGIGVKGWNSNISQYTNPMYLSKSFGSVNMPLQNAQKWTGRSSDQNQGFSTYTLGNPNKLQKIWTGDTRAATAKPYSLRPDEMIKQEQTTK